jgi:hypothetical protein
LARGSAVGGREQVDRAVDVEPAAQLLSEAFRCVERDVAETVQLVQEHDLDKLV